jgi:hypothetical protein
MAGWKQVGKLLVTGIAACALLPSTASAGTYTVWSCRGPAGEPLSAGAWVPRTVAAQPGDVVFDDGCADGEALAVSLAPGRAFESAVVGLATFAAPPRTRIAGYELWRSLATAPPELLRPFDYAATVTESAGGASTGDGCSTHSSGCLSAGDPGDRLAAENRVTARGTELDAVALEVSCQWGWCEAPAGTPARAELYRASVQVSDTVAPTTPILGGELASGAAAMSGPAALSVASSDPGAGIASVSLSIDDGAPQIASSAVTHPQCHAPYVAAPPCPTAVAQTFTVDAALPAGRHTASGVVTDAAGNETPWGPIAFTVDQAGGAPPSTANGTPAVADPKLRLRKPSKARAPDTAATIAGTLRTASGAPVAGALLTLSAVDLGVTGARPHDLAPVTTDAQGRFAATLKRNGAQRVVVAFAPRPGADATTSASVTLRTRLSLTAAPTPSSLVKGRVLTMRGRLRGAGPSARGAVVRIDAIVNSRWSPVGVARAARGGRYRWRYRFVNLSRDTTFSFRAVVERAPGWPWATVRTGRLTVEVDVP